MARHRNVRTMNYDEDYEGYDDVYGHSVEDDYIASPSMSSYLFDRNRQQQQISSYLETQDELDENDEALEETTPPRIRHDSSSFQIPKLNAVDEAKLKSCLDAIHDVVGDSIAEHIIIQRILQCDFDYEKSLNAVLSNNTIEMPDSCPLPQRDRKDRKRGKDLRQPSKNASIPSAATNSSTPVIRTINTSTPSAATNSSTPVIRTINKSTPSAATNSSTPVVRESKVVEPTILVTPSVPSPKVKKSHVLKTGSVIRGFDISGDNKKDSGSRSGSKTSSPCPSPVPTREEITETRETPKSAQRKGNPVNAMLEYSKERGGGKDQLNLVVIGHVDAGKSTLMGHLLYQLGEVNKRVMHKYEQESKKAGKQSFVYAWVLDETGEERTRGITMDVGHSKFETDHKVVRLLDAPGHKDFIPNMITGAAQADVAILVVDATRGEFETGFESGGQTREHAVLVRSLGVSQLGVAVNKLDTVSWSKERFDEIKKRLGLYLKQVGFKDNNVTYIPCSGLTGENLTKTATEELLTSWYSGPTLLQVVDNFQCPDRPLNRPFRLSISDVFKGTGSGFCVSGKMETGCLQTGDKILVQPQGEMAAVKNILMEEVGMPSTFAGDHVVVNLSGIEMQNVSIGFVLCDPSQPISVTSRIQARIVVFNISVPITKGYPVLMHYQSLSEQATVKRLISVLNKSSGEILKKKPRCLTKNSNALIELEIGRPICMELYRDVKELGRFMLRSAGSTIAAGMVTEIY